MAQAAGPDKGAAAQAVASPGQGSTPAPSNGQTSSAGVPEGGDNRDSMGSASKRHKPEQAGFAGSVHAEGGVSIQIQVFSRQRGKFEVVVSWQGSPAGRTLERCQAFSAIVRNDVALVWAVPAGRA